MNSMIPAAAAVVGDVVEIPGRGDDVAPLLVDIIAVHNSTPRPGLITWFFENSGEPDQVVVSAVQNVKVVKYARKAQSAS